MRICELVQGLGELVQGDVRSTVDVSALADDSRSVAPGALFVARQGASSHGASFITDAVSRGAVAILTDHETRTPAAVPTLRTSDPALAMAQLAERFYGEPSSKLKLIGVTGTNGKTTTAHLIQQILNQCGARCGLIGTVLTDDGADLIPSRLTTPGAIEISAALARMVKNGCAAAVMEVSSHALQQRRTDGLAFDAAVFTNLSGDHLDYHGSMNAYAAIKATLFENLTPDAVAVINGDDPLWERFARSCSARIIRCSSQDEGADAHISSGPSTVSGADVALRGPWGLLTGRSWLPGEHNLMNLLQAVAAAHAAQADVRALDGRINELRPPPGRLEPVTLPGAMEAPTILVDYAHTDDALSNALRAVRPLLPAHAALWVVFGCGGDRDATKRPRMGAVASKLSDRVVITSDNPRREGPQAIIEDILAGVSDADHGAIEVEADRSAAIRHAVMNAGPDDIILIAGKGHEDYQIISDGAGGVLRRDFDDRIEARQALTLRLSRCAQSRPVTP